MRTYSPHLATERAGRARTMSWGTLWYTLYSRKREERVLWSTLGHRKSRKSKKRVLRYKIRYNASRARLGRLGTSEMTQSGTGQARRYVDRSPSAVHSQVQGMQGAGPGGTGQGRAPCPEGPEWTDPADSSECG